MTVTAALAHDLYGERARRATPRNLALSSGLANVALAPFGALPMCHGAGGLVAHHRFGARTALAPLVLGGLLLGLGLIFADRAGAVLAVIPLAAVGALLLFSAADLAFSRRLFDARPSCWPVIGITAALTAWADPFWGSWAAALPSLRAASCWPGGTAARIDAGPDRPAIAPCSRALRAMPEERKNRNARRRSRI